MLHPTLDECLDDADFSGAFEGDDSEEARSSLCSAPISTLRPKAAAMLAPSTSLAAAIAVMQRQKCAAVLVVENGNLKGIFTERDVLDRIVGKTIDLAKACVAEVMTPDPEVLALEDPIAFVLNRMTVGGYRHVPILDAAGHPCGIISVKDVIRYIVDARPCEVYNLRPEPMHKGFESPEGA